MPHSIIIPCPDCGGAGQRTSEFALCPMCLDSPRGYLTGCEHNPADVPPWNVGRCPWCGSADNAYYAGGAIAFQCGTSISKTGSARGVQCIVSDFEPPSKSVARRQAAMREEPPCE